MFSSPTHCTHTQTISPVAPPSASCCLCHIDVAAKSTAGGLWKKSWCTFHRMTQLISAAVAVAADINSRQILTVGMACLISMHYLTGAGVGAFTCRTGEGDWWRPPVTLETIEGGDLEVGLGGTLGGVLCANR